jgi:hypothetical protein
MGGNIFIDLTGLEKEGTNLMEVKTHLACSPWFGKEFRVVVD